MSSDILLSTQQASRGILVSQLFTRKELVGKGAYGGVYKGVHNQTGTVVALKVIDLDTPEDDISEIQKEVALLSEMRDAARYNITLYHGCYLNGHELWIAMDFASGGSIRTLMKSGPIDEKYIVLIVREILVALAFLHRQNIIHRDVKAANILLTQVGKILLCDFGVAAHLQTNNKRSTFIGTPLWMAPEVITDGKLYDTKADIWSLGVTVFEIATGNPPYFGMEPLRACALIPRTAPAKLENGPWSGLMRDFLGLCLQVDPTNRPTADELSKTKWIKSGSKLPMSLLRELIVRYVSWIQTGGQRMSLAGLDSLTREDTFDIEEEDVWDFGSSEDEAMEGLPDEPPRTLDAQAAISSLRPPKTNGNHVNNVSRNHPLLRLFDAESNPYASSSATQPLFSLPTGAASMDTVRPLISIPTFEEMDELAFASSSTPQPRVIELPSSTDLATPTTVRPNPFSWTQQPMRRNDHVPTSSSSSSNAPTSFSSSNSNDSNTLGPRGPIGFPIPVTPYNRELAPESPWGTTTLETFSDSPIDSDYYPTIPSSQSCEIPVTTSPSLPSLPVFSSDNRPFTSRRRADTAPSFEPPSPFCQPPSAPPYQSQYYQPHFSAAASVVNATGANRPFGSNHSANPSLSYSLPPSASASSASTSFSSLSSSVSGSTSYTTTTSSTSANWSPPSTSNGPSSGSTGLMRSTPFNRSRSAMENGASIINQQQDVNRPFRERKGSDATSRGGGTSNLSGSRNRTGSDARPSQPPSVSAASQKFNIGLRITTTNGGSNGYHPFSSGLTTGSLNSPPSPTQLTPLASSFPPIADVEYDDTEEGPGEVDFEAPETEGYPFPVSAPWPLGPTLTPLDYAKLVSADDVHEELMKALGQLEKWLVVVDDGLGRILSGSANNAVMVTS